VPIASSDIGYRLSGGAGNTNANASLGGVMSSTVITTAQLNNLFDNVSGPESSAGTVSSPDFRCFYVRNGNGSLTWQGVSIWIDASPSSAGVGVDLGLDPAAVGNNSSVNSGNPLATETTVPTGVTFTRPTVKGTLVIGDMGSGAQKAIWERRTIQPSTGAVSESFSIRCEGDSPP
jgi:hypothetical protein